MTLRPLVAVCVRHRVAALVVVATSEFLEVARCNLRHRPAGSSPREYLVASVKRIAADYGANSVVAEDGSVAANWLHESRLRVTSLNLEEVRRAYGGAGVSMTELVRAVVQEHPELARFVTIARATGRVAMSHRHKTVVPLAAALGRVAQHHRLLHNGHPAAHPDHVISNRICQA